jgi:DNA repair ATPase RecN
MSFFVQRFESGNIELAQQALNGIEYYANEALRWFDALSPMSKSQLEGFEAKLDEIKRKVNQWREILGDIWRNKGKLEQVIKELTEEIDSISGFSEKISKLRSEIAEEVKKVKAARQEAKLEELVKESDRLYNLRGKVEGLKTSISVAKNRFEIIKWEIRAKKEKR